MPEREFRPEDKSQYSWRDHARELMRLKYGMRGKDLTEALIGESEEEKYMKYLIRNYGYDPEAREELPESRPMRDLLNVQGGGPSDLGALDAILMGVSGSGTPVVSSAAAGIESGMLGGDAYGEYKKDNPWGALLMGAGAAVPPLLRYMNPPPTKKKDLSGGVVESGALPDANIQGYQLEGDTPDLSRRKAVKNIGLGIGALATAKAADPIISQAIKTVDQAPIETAAKAATKLASWTPPPNVPFVDDAFGIMSRSAHTIIDKILRKGQLEEITTDTYRFDDLEYEWHEDAANLDYHLEDVFYRVSLEPNLTKGKFDKIMDDTGSATARQWGGKDPKDWGKVEEDLLHLTQSPAFKDAAWEYYIQKVEQLKTLPQFEELQAIQKQYNENLVMKTHREKPDQTLGDVVKLLEDQNKQRFRDDQIIDPLTLEPVEDWARAKEIDPQIKAVEEWRSLHQDLEAHLYLEDFQIEESGRFSNMDIDANIDMGGYHIANEPKLIARDRAIMSPKDFRKRWGKGLEVLD
tara:strand:- start:12812 stop:14377 length:1566 start_codon:yes stop_codon:yes gene_type:complete